jgi:hypothetical protein
MRAFTLFESIPRDCSRISSETCGGSAAFSRTEMAKKKRLPKLTPEEEAERDETQRMAWERIAYHEAKAREEEEAARRQKQ